VQSVRSVRESLFLLATGLVIGLPIALATVLSLAAFLRSQLLNVSIVDPFAFSAAITVISAMTMLSAWLAARHVTKVDPMLALSAD
jgi:ABC-type antimicrobial peptide transport system permease subunit